MSNGLIAPSIPPLDYPRVIMPTIDTTHQNQLSMSTSGQINRNTLRRNFSEMLESFSFYTKAYMLAAFCINSVVYIFIIIALSLRKGRSCEQPLEVYLIVYLARGIVAESLLLLIYSLPRYWQHENVPLTVDQQGFITIMEKIKLMLDFFFVIWFIIGNWWFYSARMCALTNPTTYYLTFAIIIFGYALLAVPILLLFGLFCCLPFLMMGLRGMNHDEEKVKQDGTFEEALARLPSVIYDENFKSHHLSDVLQDECRHCVICLNDYNDGDILRLLPCFHHFHKVCVDDWLRTNGKCPFCIQKIEQNMEHEEGTISYLSEVST